MDTLADETSKAKPFLKWAGGKTQLIRAIHSILPGDLDQKPFTYIEPFIGSGAVMFWFLRNFPNIQSAVINDINTDLTQAYTILKKQPAKLIKALEAIQEKYYKLLSEDDKKQFFLEKREEFNARRSDPVNSTALLIFLNRSCFNGLYRVNRKNQFNVPFGKHKKPRICDRETILADSRVLQKVKILNGDYKETLAYATENSFFYFDPPYKPISKTSSFNSYAKDAFGDSEQIRLKRFCDDLTSRGCRWLVSNSDPQNTNPQDNFFEDLYSGENISIERVKATRQINSNPAKRLAINELLIYNY